MLFYKSLVSFITAIALAGSVTASVTPERRQTTQSCSTGSLTCCATTTPFTALSSAAQESLALLDPNLNLDLPVGLGCVLAGVLGCNNDAFCCDGTQNLNGLIDVGINCVNLPL
ncbi:hypothetical protein EI94DRAFT_1706731 [Lactarius quietus]|nr:hypothetical protein EI94DRAFT_1706731 [Lactarius quietus]